MKRKRDSPKSPHRRTPPPNQFASSSQRPLRSNFLPNASSPDSSKSSSDSSRSEKMSLNFLNDHPWTIEMDITLFEQLKKASTQQDDYLGLSWNDEKIWHQIRSKVIAEVPLICDLDEIKDRVEKYKSSYKQYGDGVSRGNFRLQMLVKDVFEKPMDPGPVIVPWSRTTSYSGQLSIGANTARGGGKSSQSHEVALVEAVASLEEVKIRGDAFLANCIIYLVDKSLDKMFLALQNDAQKWQFLKNVEGLMSLVIHQQLMKVQNVVDQIQVFLALALKEICPMFGHLYSYTMLGS